MARNPPAARDPLRARRRDLERREKELAEQMARVHVELRETGRMERAEPKVSEPPVWRSEKSEPRLRGGVKAGRTRNLARQRQRDRFLFLVCTSLLGGALLIVGWLAQTHR